jgi:KDO2-lipid IV(A) lauroyltransferase
MIAGLVRFLLGTLALLPRPVAQMIGQLIGTVNYHRNTQACQVTRANLALCYADLANPDEMVKRSLQDTGKTMLETPAVWFGHRDRIDDWIGTIYNESVLIDQLASELGLLVLLPHMGNWEIFNVFFRRYGRMTALYQPPRQAYMVNLMAEIRLRHGNTMVPTNRRGLLTLYKTLKRGDTVVVLPDQVPATGDYAPFFGQAALTDELSTRLLRKTGAKVVGTAIVRNAEGLFDVHVIEPPNDIYSTDKNVSLAAVNQLVQQCIYLDPPQYQWEYKRFRERPAGQKKIYRFKKPPGVH